MIRELVLLNKDHSVADEFLANKLPAVDNLTLLDLQYIPRSVCATESVIHSVDEIHF